jgi:Arm DNA-binding domain
MMHRYRDSIAERRTVRVKFVDSALRSLKPHRVKYDIHDPDGGPLVLRVSPDGRKTWMASYSSPEGVLQLRAIGKYPRMSIAEAREEARAAGGRPPSHPVD